MILDYIINQENEICQVFVPFFSRFILSPMTIHIHIANAKKHKSQKLEHKEKNNINKE